MATSTKVLGTVTSTVGEVKATASDGTVRILQVGDKVFSDEVISTSVNGDVKIALEGAGGRTLECGNDTTLALTEGLLGIGTAVAAQTSPVVAPSVAATQEAATPPAGKPPAGPTDVAALQAAIAAGADPSQVAEATAAGGAPGAGGADGGGGHQPVVIEQGNTSGVVTSGFNTQGGSIEFPTPVFEEFPVQPGVSVSVDIGIQPGVVEASGRAASLIEGTNGGESRFVNFVITLDKVFDVDVLITYTIVPVTAANPSDFFDGPLTQTVLIEAGQTEIIVTIQIVQDHFVESNETFNIVLTDAVNATINPNANTAVVTIIDDDALPVANPDTNWVQEDVVAEGDEAPTARGNVLQSDSHTGAPSGSFADAADTDHEPLTVTNPDTYVGTYGTLVLNADGTYEYTLNNSDAQVQALDDGQTLTDTFEYSVTDGFNAPDSSTLTITIFGSNDGPEIKVRTGNEGPFADSAQGTVNEAALAIGSNPESGGEFISGSFLLSDPNGLADIESVTINNQTVSIGELVGASFDGDHGELTVTSFTNGIANFTYELKKAVTDVADVTETDVFTLTTSDGDADSAPATITINILDDQPIARNDSGAVAEDGAQVASDNVLTNDDGFADQPKSFVSWDSPAIASFGTVQLNSNGSYTYTLNNAAVQFLNEGETRTESYNYTMKDADGDIKSATLTITITGTDDGVTITDLTPAGEGGEATVSDANLSDGTAPNAAALTKSGDFTVSAPDGIASLTVGGVTVITNGVFSAATVTTGLGNKLDITGYDASTGKVTYSYTLLDNEAHSQPANDASVLDSVSVVLTDDDGDTDSDTLAITVLDDVPSIDITGGSASVVEGQNITNGTWTRDGGADAPASVKVVLGESEFNLDTPINTGKGTLTVNSNGTWTFAAANGLDQDVPQSVSFTVKITDTDGDVDEDSHTVSITDGAGPGDAQGVALTVQEAEITDSANAAMSFTLGSDALASIGFSGNVGSITGDYADLTINWVLSGDKQTLSGTVSGEPGATIVLTLTGVNLATGAATVNVQISDEFKHVAPAEGADNNDFTITGIEVVATDIDGTQAEGLASVTVVDDVPSIDITGGSASVVEGQSITNGTWTRSAGADAPATTKVVVGDAEFDLDTAINTGTGILTVNSDGTWTFASALDQNNPQNLNFTIRIDDQDGDSASDSHTITINDGGNPEVSGGQTMTVNEAALLSGSNPSSTAESDVASLVFTSGSDAIASIRFGSTAGIAVNAGLDDTQTITWAISEDGRTLTGSINSVNVIQVVLSGATSVAAGGNTGNVTVTATLLDDMLHQNDPDADSLVISGIQVVGQDTDGDTATHTLTGVTVVDDAPSFTIINDGNDPGTTVTISAPNPDANQTFNSQFADWQYGADSSLGTPTLTGVSGNVTVSGASNPNSLILELKDAGGAIIGTLTLNADGTDTLAVIHREAAFDTDVLLTSDVTAGGPSLTKTINSTLGLTVTVTGSDGDGNPTEPTDEVNPSTQGWAVKDNQVDLGESIKFSFSEGIDLFSFAATGYTGGADLIGITVTVTYEGGATENFLIDVTEGQTIQVATLPGFNVGTQFTSVNVLSDGSADSGGFRLNNVTISQVSETPPSDLDYTFTVNVVDKDGDLVAQTFNVHLDGENTGGLVVEAIAGTSAADTLVSASGNDILIGGDGSDTFDYNAMTDAADTIKDFNLASVAGADDVLHLGDVLPAATQGATVASQLSGYVTLVEVAGNTQVQVDPTGAGNYQTLVTLEGVTGVTLQQLLTNNQIIT
ncbi:MAG: retention module-containing protein [Betaproteobacteria bacterium]